MLFSRGKVTRQAHVDIPEGTYEEEYAREGFFGRYAHLYRSHAPVGWTRIEGDLRPRALRAMDAPPPAGGDYLASRVPLLRNRDTVISTARISQAMPYHFRNADGDEVLFVHAGEGRIETDFGPLDYEKGDYLVIPRGTVYRFLPAGQTDLLVIETAGEVGLPDKGILGQHALFDPAVIRVPSPAAPAAEEREEWELRVKRCGRITSVFYLWNPCDVVGWKGNLTVWQLNIRDIRPVLSERYHLPPTAHVTFMANNVVICTFLPRPLETGDPGALKVPFYHSNIDYDEVIFYHDGEFFSRDGIEPGWVTFHPQGIHHGPQQKAVAASRDKTRTEEKAVMIDTRHPLEVAPPALDVEWKEYWKSWQKRAE
ncbi:MAG TPA: homogentisate 1,2-dioxygenase [Acidobacteria bacterium]|nr:homogentisate 1,2-dioxygenase [Acidobacteriota bacterium]